MVSRTVCHVDKPKRREHVVRWNVYDPGDDTLEPLDHISRHFSRRYWNHLAGKHQCPTNNQTCWAATWLPNYTEKRGAKTNESFTEELKVWIIRLTLVTEVHFDWSVGRLSPRTKSKENEYSCRFRASCRYYTQSLHRTQKLHKDGQSNLKQSDGGVTMIVGLAR